MDLWDRQAVDEYNELLIRIDPADRTDPGHAFARLRYGDALEEGDVWVRVHPEEVDKIVASASQVTQPYTRGRASALDPIKDLGKMLFSSLFEGRRDIFFRRAFRSATSEGKGLRLRFQIESPVLAKLPWETLHDGQDFISLPGRAPVFRMAGLTQPPRTLPPL
ncbi:MAG TPA: hypothetical protein VLS90_06440, partial [Thermodesulfobacteriota bacterium]|nr:hypothetical protein [Thermodesulfobacteriota bacterium]